MKEDSRIETRQLEVLRAIIDEYVASNEPVGSKVLADRRNLGVSPATIRNDMALLEDAGFITQPHTSAGRIPTNRGYRLFVDRLADLKPMSSAERRAIENFLEGAHDLDEIVARTVKLLAQVTKQVALVQYPSLNRSKVRHIEMISLTPARVMIVLITDTGRVEQSVVELGDDLADELLVDIRNRINSLVENQPLSVVAERLAEISNAYLGRDRVIATLLVTSLIELAVEKAEERVVLAGTSNLVRSNQDFTAQVHSVLEALEEQVVLLRLVSDVEITQTGDSPLDALTVRIGDEQSEAKLKETSLIATSYGGGAAVGVLGPTRMDYANSMRSVRAVARYLARYLEENRGA
jgi:heat-inducible transcriptional repressor